MKNTYNAYRWPAVKQPLYPPQCGGRFSTHCWCQTVLVTESAHREWTTHEKCCKCGDRRLP